MNAQLVTGMRHDQGCTGTSSVGRLFIDEWFVHEQIWLAQSWKMTARFNVKTFIKSSFPRAVLAYHHARQRLHQPSLKYVFSEIYHNRAWNDPESVSGRGSTRARTAVIRSELWPLLKRLNSASLLDAGCGDFNWMQDVDLGEINYLGADIVPEIIVRNNRLYGHPHRRFIVADISKDRLPRVDAILSRECLIHLSFARIARVLSNFRKSGAKYFLCTTHINIQENVDCPDGGWRSLNLQLPPFEFPAPLELIVEDAEVGKCLAAWRLDDCEMKVSRPWWQAADR